MENERLWVPEMASTRLSNRTTLRTEEFGAKASES